MTNQPDTETDELLDQLCDTALMWEGTLEAPTDFPGTLTEAFAPIVAAIRRHAAADALNEQARGLDKLGVFFSQQELALAQRSRSRDEDRSAEIYALRASQARADANRLRQAAKDVIAEGWEHTCAAYTWATRSDPGYGCDAPVENEGDYCGRHEPEDDEDRWAE